MSSHSQIAVPGPVHEDSPKMPRNPALRHASSFYVVALVQRPKPQWQRHCEQASMTPTVLRVESVATYTESNVIC